MSTANTETIEPQTMNYVFDMFGKSVSQILQTALNQQVVIDELSAMVKSLQKQITTMNSTIEDFEGKINTKIQGTKLTVYTKDGVPIEDALEVMQNKIASSCEKCQAHSDAIDRLEMEMKAKFDTENFENSTKGTHNVTKQLSDFGNEFKTLQMDVQKQRQDIDLLTDKTAQMVDMKLEEALQKLRSEDLPHEERFVTASQLDDEIIKLKGMLATDLGMGFGALSSSKSGKDQMDESDNFSDLQVQQSQFESAYAKNKNLLQNNHRSLYDQEYEDEYFYSSEFEYEDDREPRSPPSGEAVECRSVAIGTDGDVSAEGVISQKLHWAESRRHVGILAFYGSKGGKHKRRGVASKDRSNTSHDTDASESALMKKNCVDENMLSKNILNLVTSKVEGMLSEFFSVQDSESVRLGKVDAKVLIGQLSTVKGLKEDVSKLKLLVSMKIDAASCLQELSVRVTREELFTLLSQAFPSNKYIEKLAATFKSNLPPLKGGYSPRASTSLLREKSRAEASDIREYSIRARNGLKASTPAKLVPSRNSRLLTLNQRFLRGADGKYYLRDMSEFTTALSHNATGADSDVNPEAAFDHQPFRDRDQVTNNEVCETFAPVSRHRSRTPPSPSD